jgi:hypothetical protein
MTIIQTSPFRFKRKHYLASDWEDWRVRKRDSGSDDNFRLRNPYFDFDSELKSA